MLTGRYFVLLALVTLGCHGVCAETPGTLPMTKEQKQGALFLDALSIPSPGEVFAALTVDCHPNWVTLVTPATAPVTSDRTQLALTLGVLAANGYIAVAAQDGQQVKNVGREMMTVAKSLGVSENLMGRGNSLMEFAENSAWDSLSAELEATEQEIRTTMIGQKDHHLVTLSSVAAWLRGLEIATQIVLSSGQLKGIDVVRQPVLARQLASELEMLPERIKKGGLLVKARQTLLEAAHQLETMGTTPQADRAALERIHEETAKLTKEILASSDAVTPSIAPSLASKKDTNAANLPQAVTKP
jgi:hypothetical protein